MLVTGDPVPGVERERGPFVELIRRTLAGAWAGPLAVLDARRGELPALADTTALVITGWFTFQFSQDVGGCDPNAAARYKDSVPK